METEESTLQECIVTSLVTSEIDVKVTHSDDDQILPNDKYDCDIVSICALLDGMFLVADHRNEKLKRLDNGYNLVDSVHVENIRDVCEVKPGLAAAAMFSRLSGMVQLISVGMSLTKLYNFVVDDVCRSLTFTDDKLFVCHPTYVATYNLKGDLLQVFKHDNTSQQLFTSVWGIDKNEAQKLLYVCDDHFGVVILELRRNIHRNVNTSENTMIPRGLCVTSTGHVLLCDKDSNSVLHIVPQGLRLKTILTTENGTDRPRSVCYNSKKKQLLVAYMGSSIVRIFELEKSVLEELSVVVV